MKTRNLFVLVTLLVALVAAPMAVSAQEPLEFPEGFCDNTDGVHFDPDHPLPAEEPCPPGSTYDLVNPVRASDKAQLSETLTELSWQDVMGYEAGIIWAHAPTGAAGEAAKEQTGKPLPAAEAEKAIELQPVTTECGSLAADRDAYLKCLDKFWRQGRAAEWLGAIGVSGFLSEDSRQPDEYLPPGSKQTVRGVQVTVEKAAVSWPACITTDVRERFVTDANSAVYEIANTDPIVYMATNVVATGPISVWGNCRDWKEMVALVEGGAPAAAATPTPELTATPTVEVKEATPTPTATATTAPAAAAPVATATKAPSETGGGEKTGESSSQAVPWSLFLFLFLLTVVAFVAYFVARRRDTRMAERLAELEAELVASRRQTRVAPGDEGPNV